MLAPICRSSSIGCLSLHVAAAAQALRFFHALVLSVASTCLAYWRRCLRLRGDLACARSLHAPAPAPAPAPACRRVARSMPPSGPRTSSPRCCDLLARVALLLHPRFRPKRILGEDIEAVETGVE